MKIGKFEVGVFWLLLIVYVLSFVVDKVSQILSCK